MQVRCHGRQQQQQQTAQQSVGREHHVTMATCVLAVHSETEPSQAYRAMLCIHRTIAMALCLSVCPSDTSRCSTKTAKRRITQTTPHDSRCTLVFWCQRSPRTLTGVTPCGGNQMQVGWLKIGDCRQIAGYISKTVQDRRTVSIKVE